MVRPVGARSIGATRRGVAPGRARRQPGARDDQHEARRRAGSEPPCARWLMRARQAGEEGAQEIR